MSHTHALPSELTIYTIGEFYSQCLAWLGAQDAGDACFHLQAQGVQEVDAAGIQLLIALSNELQRHQRALVLHQPSSHLAEACTTLGVAALLTQTELIKEAI